MKYRHVGTEERDSSVTMTNMGKGSVTRSKKVAAGHRKSWAPGGLKQHRHSGKGKVAGFHRLLRTKHCAERITIPTDSLLG